MATVKTYDPKCHELAAFFLGDEPDLHTEANIHALALEIQQFIEDEIYFMRAAPELYATALPSLAGIVATVLSVGIVGMCFVIAATPFAAVFR